MLKWAEMYIQILIEGYKIMNTPMLFRYMNMHCHDYIESGKKSDVLPVTFLYTCTSIQ